MNYNSLCSPDKLQETYRLMLMTLEYGGSVNTKVLEELEEQVKQSCNHDQNTVAN